MLKRLIRHPLVQAGGARLAAGYLDWALRTTRWTVDGAEHLAPFLAGQPAVVAFWHERLPLMPAIWNLAWQQRRTDGTAAPASRIHVLVSRHRDGRLIGEVVRRFSVALVHGSTRRKGVDRGGADALRTLVAVLRAGGQVAITPDGPRGPRRRAAGGVAQLAARTGVPVVPVAAQARRRHVLRSWDRMVLPLPWGRGVLVCGQPIAVPAEAWDAALPGIEAALDAVTDRADALCC